MARMHKDVLILADGGELAGHALARVTAVVFEPMRPVPGEAERPSGGAQVAGLGSDRLVLH